MPGKILNAKNLHHIQVLAAFVVAAVCTLSFLGFEVPEARNQAIHLKSSCMWALFPLFLLMPPWCAALLSRAGARPALHIIFLLFWCFPSLILLDYRGFFIRARPGLPFLIPLTMTGYYLSALTALNPRAVKQIGLVFWPKTLRNNNNSTGRPSINSGEGEKGCASHAPRDIKEDWFLRANRMAGSFLLILSPAFIIIFAGLIALYLYAPTSILNFSKKAGSVISLLLWMPFMTFCWICFITRAGSRAAVYCTLIFFLLFSFYYLRFIFIKLPIGGNSDLCWVILSLPLLLYFPFLASIMSVEIGAAIISVFRRSKK